MTPGTAVEIHHLSKRYRLGGVQAGRYKTLRDVISPQIRNSYEEGVPGTAAPQEIWALHNVSLDVREGEVLGIVGSNGAGKSTLLKILSRITEPTAGVARLRGRMASLLEVGTGFHPELTGRENIYLNGAILGMRRAEIHQNFDAIVAFAEVEAFLDTPVKRYSSGMYLRLAFAVAAHLTPEILIVDEVLAVGDFEFQRKCLGRMNAVARSGRTVLFVSHNMVAVEELCDRVVLLRRGVIERVGPSREVIGRYLSSRSDGLLSAPGDLREREGSGRVRIAGIEILSADGGRRLESLQFNESFRIRLRYVVSEAIRDARFGVFVLTEQGERVFLVDTAETGPTGLAIAEKGQIDCLIRSPRLVPGRYGIEAYITDPMHPENLADRAYFCLMIAVEAAGLPCQRLSLLALSNRGAILADAVWLTPVPGEIPLRAYATTDSESPSGIEDLS